MSRGSGEHTQGTVLPTPLGKGRSNHRNIQDFSVPVQPISVPIQVCITCNIQSRTEVIHTVESGLSLCSPLRQIVQMVSQVFPVPKGKKSFLPISM